MIKDVEPPAADQGEDDIWVSGEGSGTQPGEDPTGEPSAATKAQAEVTAAQARKSSLRNAIEWVVVVVGAVIVAVVIRTFVFQTFWIPSESMATTLVTNDRVVVNKLSYRFHDLNRGDVIVFERPPNEPDSKIKDLIKRAIGLPGDRVSLRDGHVYINDQLLKEPYTRGLQTTQCGQSFPDLVTEEGLLVPDGMVLVMGDNRVNSSDGRCFGPIDQDLIVGRAFMIIWPPSKVGAL